MNFFNPHQFQFDDGKRIDHGSGSIDEFCNCPVSSFILIGENEIPDFMEMYCRIEMFYHRLLRKNVSMSNLTKGASQTPPLPSSSLSFMHSSTDENKLLNSISFFRIFTNNLVKKFCHNLQTPIDHILLAGKESNCQTQTVMLNQKEIVFKFWKYFAVVFKSFIGMDRERLDDLLHHSANNNVIPLMKSVQLNSRDMEFGSVDSSVPLTKFRQSPQRRQQQQQKQQQQQQQQQHSRQSPFVSPNGVNFTSATANDLEPEKRQRKEQSPEEFRIQQLAKQRTLFAFSPASSSDSKTDSSFSLAPSKKSLPSGTSSSSPSRRRGQLFSRSSGLNNKSSQPVQKILISASMDCDVFSYFFSQNFDSILAALANETTNPVDYSTIFKNSSFVFYPCSNCGSQKALFSNGQTCGNCAAELCQISHSFNFNDSCRVYRNNKPIYDRKFVFKECFLRFQAKQKIFLPMELLKAVQNYFISKGLAFCTNDSVVVDPSVTCRDVHESLNALQQPEFVDDVILIWHKLTGKIVDDASHLEVMLMDDFEKFLCLFQTIENKEKRKTFVNSHFMLFQLLRRREFKINNPFFFHSCFDREKRKPSEILCRKLFPVLNWMFFDFDLSDQIE